MQYVEDEIGYNILHNIPVGPLNETQGFFSIGDVVCLFPISYADRMKKALNGSAFSELDDNLVVGKTVNNYVYEWEYHLDDGTISRPVSWLEEGYFEPEGKVSVLL